MPKPKIYLAGKIGKNDWRHFLVPGLRNCEWKDCPLMPSTFNMSGHSLLPAIMDVITGQISKAQRLGIPFVKVLLRSAM